MLKVKHITWLWVSDADSEIININERWLYKDRFAFLANKKGKGYSFWSV